MAKMKEEIKKPEAPEEKKKTITAFLLMFPALIAGFIGIIDPHAIKDNFVIAMLLILQFVMLEQFIKDYYKHQY